TSPKNIEKVIAGILSKNKEQNDYDWKDNFILQPLKDVHFDIKFNYNAVKESTLRNLILLAVFLLTLGAINFINLSTAQSTERAKEIGIRKTLGGKKSNLVKQFLLETFLVAGFATILSVILIPILTQAFAGFLPKGFTVSSIPILEIIGFLVLQLLVITCIAGFYPAWVLTGYSPIMALKNQATKNSNLSRSAWVRKGLTNFQFVLTQAFAGFLPKGFTVSSIPILEIIGFLVLQLLVITCIAGFYPAWVLTGYSPIMALKNQATKNSNLSRSAWVRKGLTIFQFVLAQVFLIAVLVVSKQIHYAINMDMGFNKDAVVTFFVPNFDREQKGKVLKTELENLAEVNAVSF